MGMLDAIAGQASALVTAEASPAARLAAMKARFKFAELSKKRATAAAAAAAPEAAVASPASATAGKRQHQPPRGVNLMRAANEVAARDSKRVAPPAPRQSVARGVQVEVDDASALDDVRMSAVDDDSNVFPNGSVEAYVELNQIIYEWHAESLRIEKEIRRKQSKLSMAQFQTAYAFRLSLTGVLSLRGRLRSRSDTRSFLG